MDPLFNDQNPPPGQAPAEPPNIADQPPPAPAPPLGPADAMGPMASPLDMGTIKPTGRMPGQPEFNEDQATEQEQLQYDQFVKKALTFMSQNTNELVAHMNNKERPVHQNVAALAVKLGKGVYGMAKTAGEEIGMDVLEAAGAEIVEHLMELGVAAQIFPFEEDGEEYEQVQAMAFLEAQKIVGEELQQSPQYDGEMQEQAQNFYAQQVAGEVQRGESPENFHEDIGNQVAGGVRKAIQGV